MLFDIMHLVKFRPRSLSYDMAVKALEDGTMQVRPHTHDEETALAWMQSAELAQNSMLLQSSITAVTTLGHPALVTNNNTTWAKRQRLLAAGWTQTSSSRAANAHQHILNACQSKEYYVLLLDHLDSVLFLEDRKFSHAQGVHYYNTAKSMMMRTDFASPEVT